VEIPGNTKGRGFESLGGMSLVVDPLNENVVFVSGSRHKVGADLSSPVDGIYRTLDGGNSWQLVKQTAYFRGKEGQHFVFDPKSFDKKQNRHLTVYAGTHTEGLLKSKDGGRTWVEIGLNAIRILDIEINGLSSKTILYVATNNTSSSCNGLYKVIDDGINSSTIETLGNLPDYPRTIALRANTNPNEDIIYAAVGVHKVYKSTNGGLTFVRKSNGLTEEGKDYHQIDISPADPDYLYVRMDRSGTWNPFYSHDGGESWGKPSDLDKRNLSIRGSSVYFGIPTAPHPTERMTAITYSGSTLRKTNNGGDIWEYSGNGYMGGRRGRSKTSVSFDLTNPSTLIYFLVDNGPAISSDGGETWRLLPVTRIGGKSTLVGAVDAENTNTIITAVGDWSSQTLIRSTDGGASWGIVNNISDSYRILCFHPQEVNYVYAGSKTGSWISNDNGLSWKFINGKSICAVYPKNGDVVYAIESYSNTKKSVLWMSNDKGNTWEYVVENPFYTASSVDIDPNRSDRLYVAAEGNLYSYDKAGWNNLEVSFEDNPYFETIVVAPNSTNIIYAGVRSTTGHREKFIYRSLDYGNTWEDIGYNLSTYTNVWSLAVTASGEVHMSTDHGNYVLK